GYGYHLGLWDDFLSKTLNPKSGYSSYSGKSDLLDSWVTNIDDTIHVDESPIVQFVIVLDMPNSYACAAGGSKSIPSRSKSEPIKAKANFHSLFSENVCEGANVTIPRKVVEMVFSEDGLSIIASQIDVLKQSLTMGVPLFEGLRYSVETVTIEYEWKPPRCYLCKIFGHAHDHCPKKVSIPPTVVTSNVATSTIEKTNDGFQTVAKKKKKGKSKSTNGGHFGGYSLKQTVRYEPKATTSAPKKGPTNVGNASKLSSMSKTTITSTKKGNISTSNPYSALEDESDEDVENVYDESANLFKSTKTGESSSSFTAAVGYARVGIELRADADLKDTIVVAMPKLVGEGFYMCTIDVSFSIGSLWKPPRCSSCKVFGDILDECHKNIVLDVVKNLKILDELRELFRVFNVASSRKLTHVDDDGKPLPKVVSTKNADRDSEVEDVVDDHEGFMASTCFKPSDDSGYATLMMMICIVVSSFGVVVLVILAIAM
ncbi:zinc knuckle CX2CX4HX4C containing protein, partial [Tanacetum coccineum]